jgi:hypothetical protein
MFRPGSNFRDGGLPGYEQLFGSCDPAVKVAIEATPGYLYSETALRELPHLPSRPNFIVVLREPVAQLQSLFSYFQQNWNWIPRDMTFRDFIAAVEDGNSGFGGNELAANAIANAWYPEHLRRWEAAVGRERLHILLFEELVNDSRATMQRLATELGIRPSFYDDYDFPRENSTYVARSGALQDLNIWLRSRLPQGAFYNIVRWLYRSINTRPPALQARDVELESALADRFSPMLVELERDFHLDMTLWRAAVRERKLSSATSDSSDFREDYRGGSGHFRMLVPAMNARSREFE